MLRIRLQRVGRKNIATFRIVLTESQNSTKSGRYLEVLGMYDPVRKVKEVDAERVRYWISKGAQPTETLHNFLITQKIISGKKVNVLPVKSKTLKRKDLKAAAGKKEVGGAPSAAKPATIEAPKTTTETAPVPKAEEPKKA